MSEIKKTILFDEHLKLKAKIIPFGGFDMPVQYSSVKEEYLAVRNNSGVFDVSHMGEFWVTGKEAVGFVNYIITNDIETLENNKAIYSPMCNESGGVIDDLIAYKFSNEKIMICVNASNIQKDFDWMQGYVKDFDCKLSNLSDSTSLLAVQGPDAVQLLEKILDIKLSSIPKFGCIEQELYGDLFIFARTGYTGEDGFEIFCSNNQVTKIWKLLIENNVTPCGLAARDVLRIEAGFPLYGQELNDVRSPIDSGLKWTVKLNKNNFIGMQSIKNNPVKYRSIKLLLDKGIPRCQYSLLNKEDKQIGFVTSGTMSFKLSKGIALALIELDNFNKTDEVFVKIRNKTYPAKIIKKSFLNEQINES
jgi:aminomethyltransferase